MRGSCAIAAALLLAACRVDVEGARCTLPGSPSECPDGQACGNDGRCSTRAAGCVGAGAFCTPGVTGNRCRVTPSAIETCTGTDPVCGTWAVVAQQDDCATFSLVCDASKGAPACACAVPVSEISVDVAAPHGALAPTGAVQPPECRFRRLGDALAAAANATGPMTVKALGTAGAAVVFTGEVFPLVVPANVKVAGADSPAGETVVQGDAGTAASMVTLEGTIERMHLENVSMTGNGVDMTCGATGHPTLRDVVVSVGSQKLVDGVSVTGPCGAELERVDVSGASGAALDIAIPATSFTSVFGSWFHGSGTGIQASGGSVGFFADNSSAAPTRVTDNSGPGIVLSGATRMDASFGDVLVAGNGGVGIHVNQIPTESRLALISCDVHSNGAVAPLLYGPAPQRHVGGILLTQSLLQTFLFQRNTVYANHGGTGADELAFYSSGTWPVNTGSCGSANAFGCAGTGLAVNVTSGSVDARNSIWPVISPPVGSGVTWSPECAGTAPACPP